MLMKKTHLGKADKCKNSSFLQVQEKNMSWIPAPNKYDKSIDWNKNFPSKGYGKFLKKNRYLLSHDIEMEAKK